MHKRGHDFSFRSVIFPLNLYKVIAIVVLIGLAVYWGCLQNGFVLDDRSYIVNQFTYTVGVGLPQPFSWFFSTANIYNHLGQYRPLDSLYFYATYYFFAANPVGYHILQIVLHLANTMLVYAVLSKFLRRPIALLCGLVFLVHPLQVESVVYIAASGNPLYFCFGITALYLSLEKRLTLRRVAAMSTLLLISLLLNETAVSFLIMLVAYRFLLRGGKRGRVLLTVTLAMSCYLIIRLAVSQAGFTNTYSLIARVLWTTRMSMIPAVLFYYIKNLFLPASLAVGQDWLNEGITFANFYLPLIWDIAFFASLGVGGYLIHKRTPDLMRKYIFFLMWFLIGLALHSQIVPLDLTVADRWMYWPIVGFLGLAGVAVEALITKHGQIRATLVVFTLIAIGLLSCRTILRINDWRSQTTLVAHDIHQQRINRIEAQECFWTCTPTWRNPVLPDYLRRH